MIKSTAQIPYLYFIIESIKITLFCIAIAGFFKLIGLADNQSTLIIFSMAVMSAAATFSPQRKYFRHIITGSTLVIVSIILGGILGFYIPTLAKVLSIIYAGIAFFFAKTKVMLNILATGAVMFLIFSVLPFDMDTAYHYLLYGLVVILAYSMLTYLFDAKIHQNLQEYSAEKNNNRKTTAAIVVLSLLLAWVVSQLLMLYSSISHLYWIALTVIVIIQGSQKSTISTAIKRIIINIIGALIIVLLFNYVISNDFWWNFLVLTLFLFLIFALGFSYYYRTLFIEMFVLGVSHLLGIYHDVIAIDRIVLTVIGGLIVIVTTLSVRYLIGRST